MVEFVDSGGKFRGLTYAVGRTGFAKALRLAAWQFLVKPPRIDNKPQLGVWVRIRFDFGVREVEVVEPADLSRMALNMLLTAYNFDCIKNWGDIENSV